MRHSIGILLLFIMTPATWANLSDKQVLVRDARVWVAPDHTRIVFEITGPAAYNLFTLDNRNGRPSRIVLDLKKTRLLKNYRPRVLSQGLVRMIRHGRRNFQDLRLVLDLRQRVKSRSYILKPQGPYGYRLVVDLVPTRYTTRALAHYYNPKNDPRMAASTSSNSRVKPTTRTTRGHGAPVEDRNSAPNLSANLSTPRLSTPVVPRPVERTHKQARTERPQARRTRRQIRSRSQRRRVRDIVVAIDAGHGGDDPGAIGQGGTKEKHVVMQISKRLERMINRQPGMRAVLIRQGDYYVNLYRRQEIARKHKADVFISIHADASRRRAARGVSVYTLSKRGASSQAAKWLADKENLSDLLGGELHAHKDTTLAKVLFDLSQTSTIHASRDVARNILNQLSEHGPVHGKGLGRAGFVVLKSPDIPSVLVETGFISNPYEESRLRRAHHQRKIASAIMKGLVNYFVQHAPPDTVFAKRKHVIAGDETLADIARKYRIKLSRLKTYNGLTQTYKVRRGDVIAIPFPGGS